MLVTRVLNPGIGRKLRLRGRSKCCFFIGIAALYDRPLVVIKQLKGKNCGFNPLKLKALYAISCILTAPSKETKLSLSTRFPSPPPPDERCTLGSDLTHDLKNKKVKTRI